MPCAGIPDLAELVQVNKRTASGAMLPRCWEHEKPEVDRGGRHEGGLMIQDASDEAVNRRCGQWNTRGSWVSMMVARARSATRRWWICHAHLALCE